MAYTIRILSHGRTITAEKKDILAEKIREAGIPLNVYCSGRGLCGKCFVEIVTGPCPDAGARELDQLKEKGLSASHRLSCQYEVDSDLAINVPVSSTHEDVPILPSIPHSAIMPDPVVRKYYLELAQPEISSPDSLFERILAELGMPDLSIPPELLRRLGGVLEAADHKVTVVVHREAEILAVEPKRTVGRNFGFAIDVGTTTLVMELVDLESGKVIDLEAALNGQSARGADVISRISYSLVSAQNIEELRKLALDTLNQMISRLLVRNHVPRNSVYQTVVSGNTVMNHLLLGVPLETLARAPYHAVFSRLPSLRAEDVGFAIYPLGKVYFSPNIRSFVGGDISSGLLASGLAFRTGNYMFIDLGTNGEIVLKTGDGLLATSTAAGPAFEGMNISCGLPALPGAIYKAEDAGELRVFTIGNTSPRGVCGTGLIDLAAMFLAKGEIAPGGAIRNSAKKLEVAGRIVLTQDDIRQLQLACAAIKSGIRLMLKAAGLSIRELDGIYIAGAFGNYLNIRNSMALGLLPRIGEGKVIFIGNSSLAGARLLLLAKDERDKVESMTAEVRYLSLASDSDFQDRFIEGLEFKSWA
jgi:uncharacterized 2Fe-2S/4Fe-4S cluster protein (DUF4445 family)